MHKSSLRIVLPALTLMVLTLGQTTTAQEASARYLHDAWTTENGLPQNDVRQLVQTRDGYLWMATFGGLVRYDGSRFTVFDTGNTPELRSNRILALSEDRDGTLWIGTQNGGLTSYRQGNFKTYTTKDGLPGDHVFDVEADRQGNLWLSPGGLLRLKDGHFTLYTTRDGLPTDGAGDFCEAPDGSLWFRSGDWIMRFHEGRFERYGIEGFPDDWIYHVASMEVAADGSLWVVDGYGLARIQDGRAAVLTTNPDPSAPVLRSDFVAHTYKDREGNLRLITPGGLARYEDGRVRIDTPLPELSGLQPGLWTIKAVLEDREGNIWVGTSGKGLHRFRPRQIVAYTAETGLSDQSYYAITDDGAGGLWLGNTGPRNSLYHVEGGKFRPYNINASARSLYRDRTGTLWIGTEKGLYRLQEGRLLTEHPLNPELQRRGVVEAIYEDREGNLWVGTGGDEAQEGGLYRLKNGVTKRYRTSEGLVANDVRFITQDRRGALWVGTTGGMSRFEDEMFTNYTTEQGLSHNYVREVYEDADGTLWIGTYGGGLNRLKDGHFTHITTRHGLFDNVVSRILEDDRDNFWMSCNRGIYRVSRKELNEFAEGRRPSVTSVPYGVADGMKSNETNGGAQPAGWKAADGRLWFPTIMGVVALDPDNLNRLPPPVYVEQVLIGQTPVNVRQPVEVRPGQGDLEIHYTGLSFTAPEKVRFKYRLDGYDQDWVEARERRVAYYTNISPGAYTFRVMAANNDGVWSAQDATIRIVVIPPFWRTWWFISLSALAVVAVAVLLYRRRVGQFERARAAQEAFSMQLIASQENERKRIAAELHDSLGQELLIIKNRAALGLQLLEDSGRTREQIEQIAGTASQAITEVRRIAYNLRPYHLDEIGLTQSLEELVERVAGSCPVRFAASIDYVDDLYPQESAINLYRIVQEGLSNVVEHSGATEATLLVRRNPREVEVLIEDDGRGFAAAGGVARRPGFGLNGLAERARILGGTLSVESAPEQGTAVRFRSPVRGGDRGV